jgi:protein O-mannosyl-transferase
MSPASGHHLSVADWTDRLKSQLFLYRSPATLIALSLASIVLYLVSFNGPFVYDDLEQIVHNVRLHDLARLQDILFCGVRQIRFIQNLSFALNWWISGPDPWSYHLGNLLLHLLNGYLLYSYLRKLLRGRDLAIWTSVALFLLHPLQTQAVSYVMGRVSLLQCAFFLGCLNLTLADLSKNRVPTYVLLVASLLVKESCLLLPWALLAQRILFSDCENRRLIWREFLFYLSSSAFFVVFYLILNDGSQEQVTGFGLFPFFEYLLVQLHYLTFHLSLLLNPASQSLIHEYPQLTPGILASAAFGLLVLVSAIVLFFRKGALSPSARYFLIFFALSLAPTSSLLQMVNPFAEYRLYQANIALFVLLGWGTEKLRARLSLKAFFPLAATAFVYLLSFTFLHQRLWADDLRLFQYASEAYPSSYRAHLLIAGALETRQEHQRAELHYQRAMELAESAPHQRTYRPRFLLARLLAKAGKYPVALELLEDPRHSLFASSQIPYEQALLVLELLWRMGRLQEYGTARKRAQSAFPGRPLPQFQ